MSEKAPLTRGLSAKLTGGSTHSEKNPPSPSAPPPLIKEVSMEGDTIKMEYKFTNSSETAISIANELAMQLGHKYIGTEHLLYGLIKEGTGIASKVLENQNITADAIIERIEELVGKGESPIDTTLGFTPRTKRVIENAFKEAKKLGSDFIGTEHILIGIMREGDSIAVRIMLDLNVNPQKLYNDIIKVVNEYEVGAGQDQTGTARVAEGVDPYKF